MKRLAGLVFVVMASMSTWAQAPDCTALAQQAMEMSGVNQEIDSMARLFASDDYIRQITGDKPNASEFAATVKPILSKHFDAPSLKKDMLHHLATGCNVDQMNRAVQEMQTAFVARMLQLENARYTPEGEEKTKKYMRIIQIAPPPDSQLETAAAFDEKAGNTDEAVDALFAVTRGILVGAEAPTDVVAQMQESRKLIKAQLQGTILASILCTYSGVSKQDLAKYGDELSSGPLKWYHDTVHKSFVEILEQRAEAIGRDLKAAATAAADSSASLKP